VHCRASITAWTVFVADATLVAAVRSDLRDQLQSALGTTYTLERELGHAGMSHLFLAGER